jgi:hypothetical protein
MPDAFLHLLEGAGLDLANALERFAELLGQLAERYRLFGETVRLENSPLAVVKHRESFAKRLAPVVEFLALEQQPLLTRRFVDQPIPELLRKRDPLQREGNNMLASPIFSAERNSNQPTEI